MSLELAFRLTEIMLALAFVQQSIEHLVARRDEQYLFGIRIILSVLLLSGIAPAWISLALLINALFILKHFDGPYNGGSDRMGLLILFCLCLTYFMPTIKAQEYVFGYLAMQLVLSYFISGWCKITNPNWRTGQALSDVFHFSVYPVSENLRKFADMPRVMFIMCWAVMLFELLFPFILITKAALISGLIIAAIFHFANAMLFGLNRFFWFWLAAYPSILWLQGRVVGI